MWITGLVATALLLVALYLVQRRTGNAAIADAGWTGGLALLTGWYAWQAAPATGRTWWVAALALIWALRLTYHVIYYRVWNRPEDGRYHAMRAYWGPRAPFLFFIFFQGQTVVAFLFSLPVYWALTAPRTGWSAWDTLGTAIWLIAIGGEWIADHQLESFRHNPANKGRTCRRGLWRYSRHPNYFFEWLHWFAYVAFAAGHPHWVWTWLGPVVMIFFLFKLTGIPYTEKQALRSRGEDYRRYQAETSVFFPWFPGKQGS